MDEIRRHEGILNWARNAKESGIEVESISLCPGFCCPEAMTGWQAMGCGGLVGCDFVSLKMNMALGKEVHPTLTAVSKRFQVLKLKKNHPLGLSNFQPN